MTTAKDKWEPRLREKLVTVEHYRRPPLRADNGYDHIAVVVTGGGDCYVGEAELSPKDQYVRKVGHAISVGRAYKRAATQSQGDFMVDTSLAPMKLRDAVKQMLVDGGFY